ncbi:hypothetical protein [Myxococcus sp. CA039A]|uniref:hypothetical protein n=1 Tax=Myxococcus sp. CA039A TaxID=2741737 RepID=UPI00157ACACC|nr:hypothetical protein [Myxococcus sp. CA039A]NTX56674.1 hypothetical protein [Myxococcus sp. CA039A]
MSPILLSCHTLLVSLTLASAPPRPTKSPSTQPGGPSVRIQFNMPKERFTAIEDRSLRLTVRNNGPSPVELADPFRNSDATLTYTLTGPEYPQGRSANGREVTLRNPDNAVSPDAAPRVRLGVGQALESVLELHEWLPVTRPGRYRLEARLEQPALSVESAPVEFDIVASTSGPASLGFDVAARYRSSVFATWIQEIEGRPMLVTGVYADATDDSEWGVRWRPATILGPVEPGSSDALAPWTNNTQGAPCVDWVVWRKGASVMALAEPATTEHPFRMDLEAPPESLVRPPLQTAAGELFIPFIAAGGRELRLLRFQSTLDSTEVTPGREVGRVRLPGKPIASRATIQPDSLGDAISVVLVEDTAEGLDLHHVRSRAGGGLTRVASTRLPGLRALPSSEPGLWMDPAGRLNVAVLAASLKHPRRAMLAQVRYRADGRLESPPRVKALAELPAVPRAAIARHHPEDLSKGELFWAILLVDGRMVTSSTKNGGPITPRHPVALPLELYPARDTYVLTVDPVLGPSFEPLR